MTERAHLIATFQHYGLPDRLLVDNSSPWGNHPAHPYTPIDMHRESEWSNESARRPGQTEQRGRSEVRRDGPDLTKSSTEADSDATPSLGIETVYVGVASSPTTSMLSTNLRMRTFRSGNAPSRRKSRKPATYHLISSVLGSSTLRCSS